MRFSLTAKAAFWIVAVICGILLMISSPKLILMGTTRVAGVADLAEMSEVGQAYGGISAVLSALAVVAVAAALGVQIRQSRTAQAQAMRIMQLELMRMLLGDLGLRPLSRSKEPSTPDDDRRRNIYTNLTLKYLELGHEIGYFSPDSLRWELDEQFTTYHARNFWENSRHFKAKTVANKAQKRFVAFVNEAYEAAAKADSHTIVVQTGRAGVAGQGEVIAPDRSSGMAGSPAKHDVQSVLPCQSVHHRHFDGCLIGVALGVTAGFLAGWKMRGVADLYDRRSRG